MLFKIAREVGKYGFALILAVVVLPVLLPTMVCGFCATLFARVGHMTKKRRLISRVFYFLASLLLIVYYLGCILFLRMIGERIPRQLSVCQEIWE